MCLIISRYLICFTLWNSNQIIILLWFFLSFSFISVNFGRHMKSMWFFFVGFVIRCNEEVLIQQPKWNVCLVLAISQTIEFHCFESNYDQLSWQNCVGELIERSKKKKTLTNLICRSCQMLIAIETISNESNLLLWNTDIWLTSIKHTPLRNQIPNNNFYFIFIFVKFPFQAFRNWNHHLVLDLVHAYRVSSTRAKHLTSEYPWQSN